MLTRLEELQNVLIIFVFQTELKQKAKLISSFVSVKQLQQDRKLIAELEAENLDLKSRPPPVTPRQQPTLDNSLNRSPSPLKQPAADEPPLVTPPVSPPGKKPGNQKGNGAQHTKKANSYHGVIFFAFYGT